MLVARDDRPPEPAPLDKLGATMIDAYLYTAVAYALALKPGARA